MTTSRVIRGTRAKIFLYICGILIVTGIIACYNNTLSQLEEARKSNENCRQHEENLSTQLQVISEYKQRLENSLKTEQVEHQQTKNNFDNKLNEEKMKYEKYQSETKLKYSSLQQHFSLLQTEYDDFKEETSKNQQKLHEENNKLEAKLKEVQEELKKVHSSKESLKSQYLELQMEKEKVEGQLKETEGRDADKDNDVNQLMVEREELKQEIARLKESCKNFDVLPEPKLPLPEQSSPKSFNPVLQVSPSQYQSNEGVAQKPSETNVLLNIPPVADNQQGVLDQPSNKISSSTSTAKSELKSSQANLGNAPPLLIPTVTPETIRKVVFSVPHEKKLPLGVVAVPEKKEDQHEQEVVDNRYRNVKDSANEQIAEKPVKEDIEKENGAHEEFDGPLAQNGFEGLGFGDDHIKHAEKQNFDKRHIDNLGVGNKDRKNYDQDQDYKDLQNDVQLEENEEDDDVDGVYEDRLARQKDPAVRN